MVSHRVCQKCVSIQNFVSVLRTHAASRKGPLDGADPPSFSARVINPAQILPRHASQFDPAIDKERKLISNLRQNMPVLLDSTECAALRANVEGNRLNSRFQHTHKNKLVKAHGVV